jgi:hypothetical protein
MEHIADVVVADYEASSPVRGIRRRMPGHRSRKATQDRASQL